MQPINEAVSIMIVGMITVFFILYFITVIGNLIIRFSNKYLPEQAASVKHKKVTDTSGNTKTAIEKAISIATNGKGKVTNIKKIDL